MRCSELVNRYRQDFQNGRALRAGYKTPTKVEDSIEITGFAEENVGNGRVRKTSFESEYVSSPVTYVEKLDDAGRDSRDGIHKNIYSFVKKFVNILL